jgi:ATP-dependent Clp protease adaptor protein ClpS
MNAIEEQTDNETIVVTTKPAPSKETSKPQTKRQPQYTVIVQNDDLHTFNYVIDALCRICGHSQETARRLAIEIDANGLAAVWTGTMELAELKRDQIKGFGPDVYALVPVTFPLGCYIEPLA